MDTLQIIIKVFRSCSFRFERLARKSEVVAGHGQLKQVLTVKKILKFQYKVIVDIHEIIGLWT